MSVIDLITKNDRFNAGSIVYAAQDRLGPRRQRGIQLVWVDSGWLDLWVDRVPRRVEAGQVTALVPDTVCLFQFATDRPTTHGWVEAEQTPCSHDERDDLASLPSALPFTGRMRALADLLLPRIRDPAPLRRAQTGRLAQALFMEVFLQGRLASPELPQVPPPVAQAEQWMARHFGEAVGLAEMARAAGVTPSHLVRLFRTHRGITPIKALWEIRTREGRRMLRQTGLSVAEVAYACGFQTPFHFSRRIRAATGSSPRQVRREAWGAEGTQDLMNP